MNLQSNFGLRLERYALRKEEARMEPRIIRTNQVSAVQRLLESNAEYSRRVEGAPPDPTAAGEVLTARPPGVSVAQKVDLGLWDGQELVAFADVIVGWPFPSAAHIGLLMTHGARHGKGLGRMMHDAVVDYLSRKPGVHSLRLSIVDTNADLAEQFWRKLGYEPTGEASPYKTGGVESTARAWSRPITEENSAMSR